MLFKTLSAAVFGIDAYVVDAEVDLTPRAGDNAAPIFTTVGLPDAAVRESRERIRAAINNSGFFFPIHRVTVNLAPADVKKEGSSFDLPIALGILGANGDLKREDLNDALIVGELSLDGRVRPIKGALPIAVAARAHGLKRMVLPEENAREAAVVTGLDVHPVTTLRSVVELLNSDNPPAPLRIDTEHLLSSLSQYTEDFREVRGQLHAKRALEVATSGGHNIFRFGSELLHD
jgi:magnesium chelatase family protein